MEEHFSNEHIRENETPEDPNILDASDKEICFIDLDEDDCEDSPDVLKSIINREILFNRSRILVLIESRYPTLLFFATASDILDLTVDRVSENEEHCFKYGFSISSVGRDFNGDELRFMCSIYRAEYC